DFHVTGVQTCALPIYLERGAARALFVGVALRRGRWRAKKRRGRWVQFTGHVGCQVWYAPRLAGDAWGLAGLGRVRIERVAQAVRSEERRVGREWRPRR